MGSTRPHHTQLIDMAGRRCGLLTVLARAGTDASGRATWRCRCDCGGETVAAGPDLRRGQVASCGCRAGRRHPRPVSKQRRWQRGQRAAGNCERCGRPAEPGKGQCAEHLAADRERTKARRRAWKASGLCVRCGKPRDPGSATYCPEHLAAYRERRRKSYRPTGRPRGRPRKDQD